MHIVAYEANPRRRLVCVGYGAVMESAESPVLPHYGNGCIDGVVPALLRGEANDWLPEPVKGSRCVVMLVLDGLGSAIIDENRSLLPELAAMDGGSITTVVPSTTATALTSLTTGLSPAEHGIVGYRQRAEGEVLNTLLWRTDSGRRPPEPFMVQRHTPFLGREVPVVTRSEFLTTGFTDVHLRGAPFMGWSTIAVLVEQCRALAAERRQLIYSYYPGVDTVAHEFGLHGPYFLAEISFADELVGRLLDVLSPDVTLLVTADHGQVHVGEGWLGLEPLGDLVASCSGEGRFRWVTAPRGGAAALSEAARERFGGDAWVMERDELLEGGWLGPKPASSNVRRRLGDVVLAAKGTAAFVDPQLPGEANLVGAHGSFTAAEMYVPLLAARGRASK